MKKYFIKSIDFYQKNISQVISNKGIHCNFIPTCSEYTKQAIEKYGAVKGTAMGAKRILNCNPFIKGGYDPVK